MKQGKIANHENLHKWHEDRDLYKTGADNYMHAKVFNQIKTGDTFRL